MDRLRDNFTGRAVDGAAGAGLSCGVMTSPLPPVALASRSPRRRELLETHGLRHRVVDADLDDGDLSAGTASPRAWVMSLAYLKAAAGLAAARATLGPGWVVLGADTVCEADGKIIGQPRDEGEARAIIRSLRGREHAVYTGVSLIDVDSLRRVICLDASRVSVGWIEDEEIESYLASGGWRGKAGGYNLGERQRAGWPITCSGDPDGIMGLPMRLLREQLAALVRN